jgi:catechol 2,3-dioxygenase-like lactoylglutathione lyase family enzyme
VISPSHQRLRPRPLLAVADVEASSRWYQAVLGAVSGHGGREYERLLVDGRVVLQLHALDLDHHHGPIGDPALPRGNGVAIWFEADDLEPVLHAVEQAPAEVETAVHVNPNSGQREIWLRDPDGYLVVVSEGAAPF